MRGVVKWIIIISSLYHVINSDRCKDGTSPCDLAHSVCIYEPGDSYRCICEDGWTGDSCDKDINKCDSKPCGAHGLCVNVEGSYGCKCDPGYEGDTCQKLIGMCSVEPIFPHPSDSIGAIVITRADDGARCINDAVLPLTRCTGFCFTSTVLHVSTNTLLSYDFGCIPSVTERLDITLSCSKGRTVGTLKTSITIPKECQCVQKSCSVVIPYSPSSREKYLPLNGIKLS